MIPEVLSLMSWVAKYVVLPLLGLLGWAGKRYIDKTDAKADKVAEQLSEINKKLEKEFYDKEEVDRHLDTQISPLRDQLFEMNTSLKGVGEVVGKMSEDIAILKYAVLGNHYSDKAKQ